MLKFVRVLAFAELIAGCVWLWPALFPKQLDMEEVVRQFGAGYNRLVDPPTTLPYSGIALIGIGSVTLALSDIARRLPAGNV